MNREIKFRGKALFDNEWVYGNLIENANGHICIQERMYVKNPVLFNYTTQSTEVYPDTIGQFMGCKDKNSKEIFEGDIAMESFKTMSIIEFYEGAFVSRNKYRRLIPALFSGDAVTGMNMNFLEVIGNVHDNNELLNEFNSELKEVI